MKWFDNTALTIVIIGAVNWLLVGIFRFDLVAYLFGNLSWLSRIINTIVGLCGLYLHSLGVFLSGKFFPSFVFIYPGFRQSEAGTYKYKVSACHRHP